MVHEAVGHGLEADLARRGMSVYKEKLGERIGSPLVSIVDDATVPESAVRTGSTMKEPPGSGPCWSTPGS